MESHWKSACTGNKYCELKYEDYLKIKHKPNLIVRSMIRVPCTIMSYRYQMQLEDSNAQGRLVKRFKRV